MPIWPFSSRRRKKSMSDSNAPALVERSQNLQGAVAQPTRTASMSRKRRASQQKLNEKADRIEDKDAPTSIGKENVPSRGRNQDDITALPITWRLDNSPHLRAVDADREKAPIPYNFQNATSQTSVPHADKASSSKPGTLKSKRSTFDGSNSVKRRSTQKRKDDHLREEEIRAMSVTSSPQVHRTGDSPLRKESTKRRSFIGKKVSAVSLPRADPTSGRSPPTVVEQNGWEVMEFWVNPRPPIRLSKVPAYTWDSSSQPQLPLARDVSQKVKDKMPARDQRGRRHRTIGAAADNLDSSDLRLVLERDAKRKQERERRRHDRLERKLRAAGRTRSSSEISRLEDFEKEKVVEAAASTAVVRTKRSALQTAPDSVHPALRNDPVLDDNDTVGLGIGNEDENPFVSPANTQTGSGGYATPQEHVDEGPFEDPVVGTAREVRLSIATTPPLSPVDRSRRLSARIPDETLSPVETSYASPSYSPSPAETPARNAALAAAAGAAAIAHRTETRKLRRTSQPRDGRNGAWASFFKRGGTQHETKSPEMSFANTSRESMGRQQPQQLPPHLVTDRESPFPKRSKSGPPVRTQSRFREDLPDAPISPPDSRVQSPVSELPSNAAAIAAAVAASHNLASPSTVAQERTATSNALSGLGRSDTPVSPIRSPDIVAASLASVDSEASWLASGGSIKRASVQSGAGRSLTSYRRQTPDFNASYEDLGSGHDKDAEYVLHAAGSRQGHGLDGSAVAGASREAETANETARHGSVRRKPTLIHHDPAIRSREGLLAEFSAADGAVAGSALQDDSTDESDFGGHAGARLEKARSIDYGKQHARQVSAGSAKLLDVAPSKRISSAANSPTVISPAYAKAMMREEEE